VFDLFWIVSLIGAIQRGGIIPRRQGDPLALIDKLVRVERISRYGAKVIS